MGYKVITLFPPSLQLQKKIVLKKISQYMLSCSWFVLMNRIVEFPFYCINYSPFVCVSTVINVIYCSISILLTFTSPVKNKSFRK